MNEPYFCLLFFYGENFYGFSESDLLNFNSKLTLVPLTLQINVAILLPQAISRSSHRWCSVKNGVLRNFAKFTGKHLCQGLFFNKVAGLRLWHRRLPLNF